MVAVEGDAFHTHRLLVLLTVQLQRLQVQVAHCLAGLNGFRSLVWLSKEGLAGAAERTIGDGLAFLKLLPAHGTPLTELQTSL